ncbi:hypothetical protein [Flagellimonas crocea]|uniref:hypothetical protein n=1 Tax=Flagellimonas crocea TaxID=3067311 RepID=UPI00296E5AAE|nr:hypothetical protein [Muricauda sp. DH64]
MKKNFIQETTFLDPENSSGRIKVEKLLGLLYEHPYKDDLMKSLNVEPIMDDYITIDYVDTIYSKVKKILTKYRRFNILAQTKHIDVFEKSIDGDDDIVFFFEEYAEDGVVGNKLEAISIYGAKNSFLDEYAMTKYANNLYKIGQSELAHYNVQYFKSLASVSDEYNKERNYRLLSDGENVFVRGIVSTQRYHEYGVDFAFVVAMLVLHENMKQNKGVEYEIRSAALNESKLDMIIVEKHTHDAGSFGHVSTAIKVSTNDLGNGSLNFTNVVRVLQKNQRGVYLIPRRDTIFENDPLIIPHSKKPENVFPMLNDMGFILNTSKDFVQELKSIKTIKNPDELRIKILFKLNNSRSSFKDIKTLSDIFRRRIDNEISNFSKLLEMCNKAEELNMEYDLKEKLRYIISDIILYGRARD